MGGSGKLRCGSAYPVPLWARCLLVAHEWKVHESAAWIAVLVIVCMIALYHMGPAVASVQRYHCASRKNGSFKQVLAARQSDHLDTSLMKERVALRHDNITEGHILEELQ